MKLRGSFMPGVKVTLITKIHRTMERQEELGLW